MTNWWEELELETETEKRLQAEIERLRAINARLLGTCKAVEEYLHNNKSGIEGFELEQRVWGDIINAESQPNQPTSPKLPGLE